MSLSETGTRRKEAGSDGPIKECIMYFLVNYSRMRPVTIISINEPEVCRYRHLLSICIRNMPLQFLSVIIFVGTKSYSCELQKQVDSNPENSPVLEHCLAKQPTVQLLLPRIVYARGSNAFLTSLLHSWLFSEHEHFNFAQSRQKTSVHITNFS